MLIGKQLGRYRILDFIDRGGMGKVYKAEDVDIERLVAIKALIPHPDLQKTQDAIRLFRREMKVVAKLDHPHILPLYGYSEEEIDNELIIYMVMPLREEGDFEKWLRKQGYSNRPLPLSYVMHFLRQASEALQEAHDKGIIHRDVKPSNFLLRNNNAHPDMPDLLLADFGLTKFMEESGSSTVRGTTPYMAPEQWQPGAPPVFATDQYALGIMAYHLLTGTMPFIGGEAQLNYQHLNSIVKAPCTINPYLPSGVDAVILRALAKKPEERYNSVLAFCNALQQAIDGYTDIPLVLAINDSEAQRGIAYPLTLPDGRQVTVAIPAGVQHGQQLRLEGQGGKSRYSSHVGALVVTVIVKAKPESEPEVERQLEKLTEDITALKTEISERHQEMDRHIQEISSAISQFPTVNTDSIVTQVQDIHTVLATLQGQWQAEQQSIHERLEKLSKDASDSSLLRGVQAYTIALAATTRENLYPPYHGKLVLDEPLRDNVAGLWAEDQNFFFVDGMYHAKEEGGYIRWSCIENNYFDNFAYQVQMTIVKGFAGGLVFREGVYDSSSYLFLVNSNGDYRLCTYLNGKVVATNDGYVASFQKGLKQPNILAVRANGDTIDVYVNLDHVANIQSDTFKQGLIGVAVQSAGSPTEVAFSNAKVWEL